MKRYFLKSTNRFFKWYCKNGVNVPCVVLDALNEAEFLVRNPYDDDLEEYTIMEVNKAGNSEDGWWNVVIAFKATDTEGRACYNRHSFHMRFNNVCLNGKRPQLKDIAYDWNHEWWGDTSLNDGSSPGDICTAFEMMKAVNKYFNHINW